MEVTSLAFWVDARGDRQKTPTGNKLKFPKVPLHAALRAFVFYRDKFTCQWCATKPSHIPTAYDGKGTLFVTRHSRAGYQSYLVVDHIVSLRNGGNNHPSNLQTLCDCCNAAKSGLVDTKAQHGTR